MLVNLRNLSVNVTECRLLKTGYGHPQSTGVCRLISDKVNDLRGSRDWVVLGRLEVVIVDLVTVCRS